MQFLKDYLECINQHLCWKIKIKIKIKQFLKDYLECINQHLCWKIKSKLLKVCQIFKTSHEILMCKREIISMVKTFWMWIVKLKIA
jgi:hypothetical protein